MMGPLTVCLIHGNLNPKRDITTYPTEFDERGVYWGEISHLQLENALYYTLDP